MKTIKTIAVAMGITTLATVAAVSGSSVIIQVGTPPPPPPPVVVAPPPTVAVTVGVPDVYCWDGYEYVGIVGSQYFYLGVGNVWLVCDGPRLARWHDWERGHADWRAHAIRNVDYRRDGQGHDVPRHDKDHGH